MSLITSRRLGPLCLTQTCGAFNDNLVKNAMVVLAIFKLGAGGAGLAALAGALFIAPYALLSATAGQLADRFDKSRLIQATKAAEVLLMAAAACAFLANSVPGLLGVLFGLGVQATMFGPLKYGILPDHLRDDELVAGNGLIEASTFLAILAGTVAGGALALLDAGPAIVGGAGVGVSLIGLAAAFGIPRAPAADSSLRIGWNIFRETIDVTRQAADEPAGLAVDPRPELVLGDRGHPAVRVSLRRPRRAGCGRPCRYAAADHVRRRDRRRVHAVRPAAARRGQRPLRSVRRLRHHAVHLGFRGGGDRRRRPASDHGRGDPAFADRLAHAGRPAVAGGVRRALFRAAVCHRAGAVAAVPSRPHHRGEQHRQCRHDGARRGLRGGVLGGRRFGTAGAGNRRRGELRRRAVDRSPVAANLLPGAVPVVFPPVPQTPYRGAGKSCSGRRTVDPGRQPSVVPGRLPGGGVPAGRPGLRHRHRAGSAILVSEVYP